VTQTLKTTATRTTRVSAKGGERLET